MSDKKMSDTEILQRASKINPYMLDGAGVKALQAAISVIESDMKKCTTRNYTSCNMSESEKEKMPGVKAVLEKALGKGLSEEVRGLTQPESSELAQALKELGQYARHNQNAANTAQRAERNAKLER